MRQDLYLHLDTAEAVATSRSGWSEEDIVTARAVIEDLVTVIRGVVALHDTPDGTRCRTCDMVWPCQALETLHSLMKSPDREFVRIVRELDGRLLRQT